MLISGLERESSNFPQGRYFRGSKDILEFTVALSDEDSNPDFPFWVHITTESTLGEALDDLVTEIVTTRLRPSGFDVARIANFGKRNEERIDYR